MPKIRLGLIGGNIAASHSPALHRAAGQLSGIEISYELLTPSLLGQTFDQVLDDCERGGFTGLNITYPFKEQVMTRVTIADTTQAAIGSCNTVVLGEPPHAGANTDYSGFLKAFRVNRGTATPGRVAIAGAGGVGKAIAFALGSLGAGAIALFDTDSTKAETLKLALKQTFQTLPIHVASTVGEAMENADGLVNCTQRGMEKYGGSAFPDQLPARHLWAFDAVYTPTETPFVRSARKAGLTVITGYELFLYQGLDAFRIFSGHDVDAGSLRKLLQSEADTRQPA